MTESNKKQYFSDIRVMDFLLQGIPNDIYNFVDACKTAKQMWERMRRMLTSRKLNLITLFDTLSQYKPGVIASRAKKAAKSQDPLALVAHSNVHSSHSHASHSYSHSPQPYYVIHPSLVIDYKEDYQGEIQGDAQEDKLKMMVGLTYKARMLAMLGMIIQLALQTESNPGKSNVQCYNCNAKGHYARDCPQPKVRYVKYFRKQMLLAMKDEVGGNLNEEENDFMLDNHYGDDSLEELNAVVIMMARIQPIDDKADAKPTFDVDALGEVNASEIHLKSRMHSESVHEHTNPAKLKTVINTFDDDQIDSSIIFDDPYVENNGGEDDHDLNAHDQFDTPESLIQNELETCKEWVKTLEKQPVKSWNYKEAYEELEREIRVDKDKINNLIKEKHKIQDEFFQLENATVRIRHETKLSKKAFKARENKYLKEIVDLQDKLSSHDQIVYKMGQPILK
ncbi:integrase, catalytic region, zinc finger, CCHC-type containing protein [Tanacetum coccineum]